MLQKMLQTLAGLAAKARTNWRKLDLCFHSTSGFSLINCREIFHFYLSSKEFIERPCVEPLQEMKNEGTEAVCLLDANA